MSIRVKHKRNNITNSKPNVQSLEYGELAIRYSKGNECIFIKNDNDEIVEFNIPISLKERMVFSGNNITLSPNIYYIQSSSTSELTILLSQPENDSFMNEYIVEFTTSTNGTTISLPSNIKWANGEMPTFEKGATYQISIVNNLGVCLKFN